ncbi:MAG: DUF4332 domain-containing protein [Candidatus Helarchaeota archaeon]
MSEEKIISELTQIKGLNKKVAIKLYRAGITSIKKLSNAVPEELSKITGISKKQLTTFIILARAQERKKFIEVDTAAAELSQLLEINIDNAKRLVSSGVMSIEDLAEESPDLLAEDAGISVDVIEKWIKKAKEIKRIPPEKRKVVVVPSTEISFGSKLSGGFFGKNAGLLNIYNDSSSFGQSLIFVILTATLLWLYLSMSQATFGTFSLTEIWNLTQVSILITIGSLLITFYPIVFVVGIVITIAIWLILSKIIASARNLNFKNVSAVLGFSMAPGILLILGLIGKFVPEMRSALFDINGTTIYLFTFLLLIFGVWALLTFLRGIAFSPSVQKITIAPPEAPKMPFVPPTSTPAPATEVEIVAAAPSSQAPFSAPPIPQATPSPQPTAAPRIVPSQAPAAVTPPPTKPTPVSLESFGIINQAEIAALKNAGFHTSIDLLRANSKEISTRTNIPQSKIIIWRIISDLLRIPGVDIQNAMILAKSGVRSVKHLSKINENALRVQVLDTISKEGIPTNITASTLSTWIELAKSL